MTKTTIKIDLGTKELSTGIFKNSDGTFTAMTFTQSKDGFKTRKSAEKWLERKLNR